MKVWPHRWFGFWDSGPYGSTPYPRVEEFLVDEEDRPPDREAIARYLRGCRPDMSVDRRLIPDPVTGEPKSGIMSIRTDGVWVWGDDLAEYILEYPLTIPDAFAAHIRSNDYLPVNPGDDIGKDLEWPPSLDSGERVFWRLQVKPPPQTAETWNRKWYGFWAKPGSDGADWPTIEGFLTRTEEWSDLDRICSYLKSATFLYGPLMNDTIDPVTGVHSHGWDLAVYTDGTWLWHGTLAALLLKYPLDLPPEMLAHIRQQNYVPAPVTKEARTLLEFPPGEILGDSAVWEECKKWEHSKR